MYQQGEEEISIKYKKTSDQEQSFSIDQIITKKRYSIGKHLRNKSYFAENQEDVFVTQNDENFPIELKDYISYLETNGFYQNKDLFSLCLIQNQGIGLISNKEIHGKVEIARIPAKLILDTRYAFDNPDLHSIIKKNIKIFVPDEDEIYIVEDRVLLLTLIYEYSKGRESQFYYMLNNFSKEIDILAFMSEEEIRQFNDTYLEKWAIKQKRFFDELADIFMKYIVEQNHQIFQNCEITKDIIKWLYIQIVTRTFATKDYVCFIPFAEFLNHGYLSSYGKYIQYHEDENFKINQQDLSFESDDSYTSSEFSTGSYDDLDYLNDLIREDQGECSWQKINILEDLNINKSDSLFSFNIISSISAQNLEENTYQVALTQELKDKIKDIIMEFINSFDLVSIVNQVIFAKILRKIKMIEQKYSHNEVELENQLQSIEKLLIFLKFLVEQQTKRKTSYEDNYNQKVFKGLKQQKNVWDLDLGQKFVFVKQSDIVQVSEIFRMTDYESLTAYSLLEESKEREQQERENNQIYSMQLNYSLYYHKKVLTRQQIFYQYGRLSNRQFLIRYGFALQYNKYDSYYIKLTCEDIIPSINKEALLYMKQFGVKNHQSFKLKYTEFCYQILTFLKSQLWNLETQSIEVLFFPKDLYVELKALILMEFIIQKEIEKNIQQQSQSIRVNNFNSSRINILNHNLKLVQLAKSIIDDFKNFDNIEIVEENLRKNDPIYIKIMGQYIKNIIKEEFQ